MFKLLFSISLFLTIGNIYAATCTTTSRTNYSVGQVLTSSALNSDLNQLVTKVNGLDGGCVTDGSLEAASLNATDFAAVTNGIHQGCAVSYSDANTVSVDKCILSVNGNFVKTATASTVTWGCTSCASEVVSTQYYVYAKTGSTGTILNLLISTTAPNGDGYDALGDKALGSFYNNSASAIELNTVKSWETSSLKPTAKYSFSFSYGTTDATTVCSASPCTYLNQDGQTVTSVTLGLPGTYTANLSRTFSSIKCHGGASQAAAVAILPPIRAEASATVGFSSVAVDGTTSVNSYGTIHCEGY